MKREHWEPVVATSLALLQPLNCIGKCIHGTWSEAHVKHGKCISNMIPLHLLYHCLIRDKVGKCAERWVSYKKKATWARTHKHALTYFAIEKLFHGLLSCRLFCLVFPIKFFKMKNVIKDHFFLFVLCNKIENGFFSCPSTAN